MISFSPTEEQKLIQDTVGELAKSSIGPGARDAEEAGEVPAALRDTINGIGLALASAPESAGGQSLGLLAGVLINERMAEGDAATLFGVPGFGPFVLAALELGTEEQAAELCAPWAGDDGANRYGAVAWSEPAPNKTRAGFSTVAREVNGVWTLTGKKSFVGNACRADKLIVFAQVDESAGWDGIGAFVVSADDPGLTRKLTKTLAIDCGGFGTVELDNVRATMRLAGGEDFTGACLRFFAKYGLIVAARQAGLARATTEIARQYVQVRKAFGKPIGHFQAIAFTLADRHIDAESVAELCHRAAWFWDESQDEKQCLVATMQAIAAADEAAMRCADDSVQLHGGAGYVRDVIVEKLMRDTKQMALCGMTAEQADQVAAAIELGVPLTAALVLPTPDTQSVLT